MFTADAIKRGEGGGGGNDDDDDDDERQNTQPTARPPDTQATEGEGARAAAGEEGGTSGRRRLLGRIERSEGSQGAFGWPAASVLGGAPEDSSGIGAPDDRAEGSQMRREDSARIRVGANGGRLGYALDGAHSRGSPTSRGFGDHGNERDPSGTAVSVRIQVAPLVQLVRLGGGAHTSAGNG